MTVHTPAEIETDKWGRRNTAGVVIASSLKFADIWHRYGDRQTLRGVSLDIPAGEVMCLLGPSGSGKTTLLRLAAGLVRPEKGRVFIDQWEVSGDRVFVPPEKRGIGLVFQDFALFPHLTILDNVKFGLTKLERREREALARLMLKRVGLDAAANLYPHHLSGGEQQRVALARALAPRPGILLMDEPFSGLDARLRESVREQTLALLRDTLSTVIIVTHDPEEALRIGDRIALMRDGEIVQSGDGTTLYQRPNSLFSARFFSELNIFKARRIAGGVVSIFGTLPDSALHQPGGAPAGELQLCVRPADFAVTAKSSEAAAREGLLGGYIRWRRSIGVVELLEVALPGHDAPVHLRIRQGVLESDIAEVWVGILPGKAMVFPAGEDGG